MEHLRIASRFWEELGRGLPPAILREPIAIIEPLPCRWGGESERPDPRYPTGYKLARDPNATWSEDRAWIRAEYPLFCTISNFGWNMFEGDKVLALADEFEAIGKDERLGSDPRFGLAARLMRRFAGRARYVSLPGA